MFHCHIKSGLSIDEFNPFGKGWGLSPPTIEHQAVDMCTPAGISIKCRPELYMARPIGPDA